MIEVTRNKLQSDSTKIIPISFDPIFKEVFGNEDYKDNTAYLASVLLDIPYEEVKGHIQFKSTKHKESRMRDKKCDKDVVFLVNLEDNYKINIELNMGKNGLQTIIERNYYYIANLFGGGLKEKEEYTNIRTCIQYNLNNFDIEKTKPSLERNFYMRDEAGILSLKLKIVHINIAEMKNICYTTDIKKYDKRMQRLIKIGCLIMSYDKKEFKKSLENIDAPKKIKEDIERIVEYMNEADELRVHYYDWFEEQKRINRSIVKEEVTKGIEKGIEQGLQKGQQKILKNMKNKGLTIKEIAELTNLSEKNVQKLLI